MSLAYTCSNRVSLELNYSMGILRPNISSLDPYIDRTVPIQLTYGNAQLKPEQTHGVSFTANLNMRRYTMRWTLSHLYTNDILLEYRFLRDNILHITKDNIGKKHALVLDGYFSSRLSRKCYLRLVPSLSYFSYKAPRINAANDGLFFRMRGLWEQELPFGLYLELEGRYNTRYIMLQGKGSTSYSYNLSLSRSFLNGKLRFICSAGNFLPAYYTKHTDRAAEKYSYHSSRHYCQASFNFSVRYRFGHLKSRVKETQKGISNNDIKYDYDE